MQRIRLPRFGSIRNRVAREVTATHSQALLAFCFQPVSSTPAAGAERTWAWIWATGGSRASAARRCALHTMPEEIDSPNRSLSRAAVRRFAEAVHAAEQGHDRLESGAKRPPGHAGGPRAAGRGAAARAGEAVEAVLQDGGPDLGDLGDLVADRGGIIAEDREKSVVSSESFIKLAMIHLMLNRLEPKQADREFHYRKAA